MTGPRPSAVADTVAPATATIPGPAEPGPALGLATAATSTPASAPASASAGRPLRIQVRLRLRPDVSPKAMETAAARLPAVYAGSVLAGDHDLQLHLACRDAAEVSASIAELRRNGAAECQVEVVLRGLLFPQADPDHRDHPTP